MLAKYLTCAAVSLCLCPFAVQAQTLSPVNSPSPSYPQSIGIVTFGPNKMSPQQRAEFKIVADKCTALDAEGNTALREGRFADAEVNFRAALELENNWGPSYQGLAESLTGQGRTEEAIAVYRQLIYPNGHWVSSTANDARTNMAYAILLSQTGQWQEAVAIYNRGVRDLPGGGDLPQAVVQFSPDIPQPAALQAAAHIGLALDANFTAYLGTRTDDERALNEYAKALQLEPNWDTAKYFYAYGLKRLRRFAEARAQFTALAATATDPALKAMAQRDAR